MHIADALWMCTHTLDDSKGIIAGCVLACQQAAVLGGGIPYASEEPCSADTYLGVQFHPGKKAKAPLLDVFGHVVSQQSREEVSCMHCNRRIAACRCAFCHQSYRKQGHRPISLILYDNLKYKNVLPTLHS